MRDSERGLMFFVLDEYVFAFLSEIKEFLSENYKLDEFFMELFLC